MNIRIEHEVPMSANELWQTLYTPEFDAFLVREYELKSHTELEKQVSDNMIHRRVRIVTGTDQSYISSATVQRLLGGRDIIYEEIQYKYLDRYEMRWETEWIEPSSLKDKVRISGVLRLAPIDDNLCLRIMEGTVNVRVFGLGGLLERIMAQHTQTTGDMFSQVVAKWKSEKAKNEDLD